MGLSDIVDQLHVLSFLKRGKAGKEGNGALG